MQRCRQHKTFGSTQVRVRSAWLLVERDWLLLLIGIGKSQLGGDFGGQFTKVPPAENRNDRRTLRGVVYPSHWSVSKSFSGASFTQICYARRRYNSKISGNIYQFLRCVCLFTSGVLRAYVWGSLPLPPKIFPGFSGIFSRDGLAPSPTPRNPYTTTVSPSHSVDCYTLCHAGPPRDDTTHQRAAAMNAV